METANATEIFGVVAEFETPAALLHAANKAREAGYKQMDGYSPFPVHGLAEALGFPRTQVPLMIFIGGLIGCIGGYFMQWFCAVEVYPYNAGGRGLNSWPAFIPITFECTVLLAAFTAVFGMFALNGLPQPYHPLFHLERFERATQDRFFLCIEATDPKFNREQTRAFLLGLQSVEVSEVPN
jgi:hypothetical protein